MKEYQLGLHEADVDDLSQCDTSIVALRDWLEGLPLANVGECARQVYIAVQELAALRTDPSLRLEMLEALRDTAYYVCDSLGKHFLNQPPLLQEKQSQVANLAQLLQHRLAKGYMLCAVELFREGASKEQRRPIALAIHRSMSDLSRTLLRSSQIYTATLPGLWLDLHQLHQMARDLQLADAKIDDSHNRYVHSTSLTDAYKRPLLLGCSRPSQLRQRDLATIFDAIERWLPLVELPAQRDDSDLYGFDPARDMAPTYREEASANWQALRLERLIDALSAHIESISGGARVSSKTELVPATLPIHVLDHLVAAWSTQFDRMEPRRPSDEPIQVCVGITAVEYFLAGQVDFDLQMSGGILLQSGNRNPFLDQNRYDVTRTFINPDTDGWSKATDAGHGGFGDINVERLEQILGTSAVKKYKREGLKTIADLADKVPTQALHHPRLVNRSPGGCCLEWADTASDRLQDGQLVAIREAGEASWRLGCVQWIQQCADNSLQSGIRFIANNAIGCGAAVSYKERSRIEFMRGLELPEVPAEGTPATLILPNVPFKPDLKIFINRLGRTSKAVLGKTRLVTANFSQFEFREIGRPPATEDATPKNADGKAAPDRQTDPFDNIWDEL